MVPQEVGFEEQYARLLCHHQDYYHRLESFTGVLQTLVALSQSSHLSFVFNVSTPPRVARFYERDNFNANICRHMEELSFLETFELHFY